MFRVSCISKVESTVLFDRPFKAETSGRAIRLAKDYARKKGIDPKGCKFKEVEQK